jgi:hypothetical protein
MNKRRKPWMRAVTVQHENNDQCKKFLTKFYINKNYFTLIFAYRKVKNSKWPDKNARGHGMNVSEGGILRFKVPIGYPGPDFIVGIEVFHRYFIFLSYWILKTNYKNNGIWHFDPSGEGGGVVALISFSQILVSHNPSINEPI